MILEIKNLKASIENKQIIKGLNLKINKNEIHVIMGPNGSGKSTLAKVIAGHPLYTINDGSIKFNEKNLKKILPEKRVHEGLFLAFQNPLEIAGVSNYDFLKLAYNNNCLYNKKLELTPIEFMALIQSKLKDLHIPLEFLNREVNQGFSGGEKKKNEILQMLLLDPKLTILDELDSGLDMDALKIICEIIIKNFLKNNSLLIITHYPHILNYLKPDFIHIMMDGKIVKTGNIELIEIIKTSGYKSII